MADPSKSEAPTPKRREEARNRGQVAKSMDLTASGVLLAGLIGLMITAPKVVNDTGGAMRSIFSEIARPHNVVSGAGLKGLAHLVGMTVLKCVAPIAGMCLAAGMVLNVLQVGVRLTPQAVKPKFSGINPANGFKSLFSSRTSFNLVKDLIKVAVVGGLVALTLAPDLTHLGASVGTTPDGLGKLMESGVKGIVIRAVAAYLLIGIVDFVWQRHRFEQSLKMTKQEVKDETRQRDLPPEIKRAIRRRQYQAARARMMAAIPRADVVVTNPTHYAVALEYSGEKPAPVVIAKGTDHVAMQIRRIAEEHDVPIVPDPPLARELYRTVELDQMIPADLYAAVAQVLAFVYRLAARKRVGV
ncbi:MAG TPA: flagellar biosynthesis protein FlhB [Solirubrobacteraceae bacterium]|nr:flagellar biosynthesis protein FlhB [Solirubrobacteraceae bacterium]